MLITECLLQTLPSDRMYEFNLNYILKKIRDFDYIIENEMTKYLKDLFNSKKLIGQFCYEEATHALDLEVFINE